MGETLVWIFLVPLLGAQTARLQVRLNMAEQEAAFSELDFRTFLLSAEERGKAPQLRATLERWKQASMEHAAGLAFAYLPTRSTIHATICPVIKPLENSFVFETKSNPAIFLYIDPQQSPAKFTNTVAHELHHIGFGTACPPPGVEARWKTSPPPIRELHRWVGGMLAAAGGPKADPQPSHPEEWAQELRDFDKEFAEQNAFFLQILEGKMTDGEAISGKMSSYFGNQGLWYGVGWKMTATIENTLGRERVIEVMCSQDGLLATYNEAAERQKLALWSEKLAAGLKMTR